MTSKIKPIDRSYRSNYNSHDQDKEDKRRKKKKDFSISGPAVINHVVSKKAQAQARMKQLQLPFDDLDLDLRFLNSIYIGTRGPAISHTVHM